MIGASCQRPRAGEAAASELEPGKVPIVLPVHLLTHPDAGLFIVDTGIPEAMAAGGPGPARGLVRPFADPSVGAVSSEDVVEAEGGENAYVRYEMALRRLETRAATLIGLSGSLFAVRREITA